YGRPVLAALLAVVKGTRWRRRKLLFACVGDWGCCGFTMPGRQHPCRFVGDTTWVGAHGHLGKYLREGHNEAHHQSRGGECVPALIRPYPWLLIFPSITTATYQEGAKIDSESCGIWS